MKAVADNDILLKGACYGLLPEFWALFPARAISGYLAQAYS